MFRAFPRVARTKPTKTVLLDAFRNIECRGEHDDWRLRTEPFHFDCKLLPAHFGRDIVHDGNINRMAGSQFQPVSPAESSKNGIPERFRGTLFRIPANFGHRLCKEELRFAAPHESWVTFQNLFPQSRFEKLFTIAQGSFG